ncbi:MAG: TonB-dependent receptor plug domain-containing protein [Geopsychrobacter sp.]|nr:TonB-dependent receptor plug domain-containing protein [Geopsychrobacter sp.]
MPQQNIRQNSAQTLPAVIVESTRLDPLIGASTLSKELIDKHPNRNGSINELLSIMPGVHFAEKKDSSFTGGEIEPPSLSISGGRINDNDFLIDGIGNNSLLDPLFDGQNSISNIPGHPQEIFLGTRLLEQVTVYEHNIPARFGGFTGGVVASETRDPSPDYTGSLSYSTTRDEWTNFFVAPADQENFSRSDSPDQQPEFNKQFVSAEVNLPLSPNSGILAAYEQRYSKIPLYLLTQKEDQSRRIETYFLKYLLEPTDADSIRLTTTYSPYEAKVFLRKTKDSQFTLNNDAFSIVANYQHEGLAGDTELRAAYRSSQDRREAPQELFKWDADDGGVPTSKPWGALVGSGFSKEGGLGDLERTQQSLNLSADWTSIPLDVAGLEHTLNLGVEYEGIKAELKRKENAFSYTSPKLANVICAPADTACIAGEQYLSKRKIYTANSASTRINQYDIYAEDKISIQKLTIRPGIRYSYDNLMQNQNLAPRLASSYDLFGNQQTILIGGANRYYDRSILTYKIREGIKPFTKQTRSFDSVTNSPTPWANAATISPLDSTFTKLKTPYADEQSLGLDQALLGGRLLIEYIQRQYSDQLAKEVDPFIIADKYRIRHIRLNNNGSRDYKNYRLSWERQWKRQFLSFNFGYEEVKSSNDSYDDTFDSNDLTQLIWYQNQLISLSDLPRDDYTRPWTANLTWITQLSHRVTFTNVAKFQDRYKRLEDTRVNAADGNDIYDQVTKPRFLTFDWRIEWKSDRQKLAQMILNLDIYNVFDNKNQIGTANNEFGLGRQFWANAEILF